jgi:hypothetical protein
MFNICPNIDRELSNRKNSVHQATTCRLSSTVKAIVAKWHVGRFWPVKRPNQSYSDAREDGSMSMVYCKVRLCVNASRSVLSMTTAGARYHPVQLARMAVRAAPFVRSLPGSALTVFVM